MCVFVIACALRRQERASFLGVFHHLSTFPMLVSVAAAIVVAMIALVREVGVQGRVQRR
jgi:hypothetical protein